jgi:hypothetical protein
MGEVVERIRAEIARAKQHIQDFELGWNAFKDTGPYAVAIKEDAKGGKRIYYVSKADPLPYALAAIAADVIQNLRSPLDQTAYQLVLDASGGTEPKSKVYYPIAGNAAAYPSTRGGAIKGVRKEVVDAIDATEPYKGGKGDALWRLNALNKINKHKLLIGAGGFYSGVDISPTFNELFRQTDLAGKKIKFPPLFINPADKLLALKKGDELWIEPLDHKVAENRDFRFNVSLNQPGITECEPALKTLQDMANLVDAIVTELGKFLP